jgi:hypothetical protein
VADAKVIVIEPADSEAHALQTLLRFLDLDPLHVHDLDELRRHSRGEAHDCLAVIVGKETVASAGAERKWWRATFTNCRAGPGIPSCR